MYKVYTVIYIIQLVVDYDTFCSCKFYSKEAITSAEISSYKSFTVTRYSYAYKGDVGTEAIEHSLGHSDLTNKSS